MSGYRELDADVFNGPDASGSWINLGLWTKEGQSYESACEAMAYAVGQSARLCDSSKVVVDFGFGFGDSLLLWKRKFNVDKVIGVNITPRECEAALEKLKDDPQNIEIVCDDAVEYVSSSVQETPMSVTNVVVVDSLYHFNTRISFLRKLVEGPRVKVTPGGCIGAVDILAAQNFTDDVDPERISLSKVIKKPFSFVGLWLLSLCAGVPLNNLMYDSKAMVVWCQQNGLLYRGTDVTANVLAPFSRYALSTAWNGKLSLKARMVLMGSSVFMRMMALSGLVRVQMYSLIVE